MEHAGIIQFLVVVGVLGYGIWSAVQKSKRTTGNSQGSIPSRHLGGENFPFPASTEFKMGKNVGVFGDGDEVSDKTTVNDVAGEMADRLATASIQPDRQEDAPYNNEMGENRGELDLRTMIIYSELLKPKYLED